MSKTCLCGTLSRDGKERLKSNETLHLITEDEDEVFLGFLTPGFVR